ncbi:MAG: hypothetical protein K2N56_08995 [Oscillospiraceae bacterium]|nr:hypothetical protein [Oscillospiraceae bacterium]
MENAVLKNNLTENLDTLEYVDEYDDTELSEELIADLNLALEQIERGEGISADEMMERLSKRYGNRI